MPGCEGAGVLNDCSTTHIYSRPQETGGRAAAGPQTRLAEGPGAGVGELPPLEGADAVARPSHRLRGSQLPQYRRVLASRDGDLHRILGDTCTRACGYCNVTHGRPSRPIRTSRSTSPARSVHCSSITSSSPPSIAMVADYGASHFARTIIETRARIPSCRLEVLIPDFKGDEAALRTVLDARPDVLNHNIETVPRLYRTARPGGRYDRALQLLDRSRSYAPALPTKSGLMVGLGEEWEEVVATLSDLRSVGCQIVTIGQYCVHRWPTCRCLATTRPPNSRSSSDSRSTWASATSSQGH